MNIKIIEEETIHLTMAEHTKYRHQYEQYLRFLSGPVLSFEEYVRSQRNNEQGQASALGAKA